MQKYIKEINRRNRNWTDIYYLEDSHFTIKLYPFYLIYLLLIIVAYLVCLVLCRVDGIVIWVLAGEVSGLGSIVL